MPFSKISESPCAQPLNLHPVPHWYGRGWLEWDVGNLMHSTWWEMISSSSWHPLLSSSFQVKAALWPWLCLFLQEDSTSMSPAPKSFVFYPRSCELPWLIHVWGTCCTTFSWFVLKPPNGNGLGDFYSTLFLHLCIPQTTFRRNPDNLVCQHVPAAHSLASWGLQFENPAFAGSPDWCLWEGNHGNMHLAAGTLLIFQNLLGFLAGLLFFLFMPLFSKALPNYRTYLTTSFWAKKWKVSLHADRLLAAACELPCLKWWCVCVISFSLIAFSWLFSRYLLSPQKLFISTLFCINKYAFQWMFCLLYVIVNLKTTKRRLKTSKRIGSDTCWLNIKLPESLLWTRQGAILSMPLMVLLSSPLHCSFSG